MKLMLHTLTSPQLKPGCAVVLQKKHRALRQAVQGVSCPGSALVTTMRALHSAWGQ